MILRCHAPRITPRAALVLVLLAAACSTPANTDGGRDAPAALDHVDIPVSDTPAESPAPCITDPDCSDDVYCNGVERCMPGARGADSRGCLGASPSTPCLASQTCDESARTCHSECGAASDADSDGHRASACGGDDCDDADPNRFPGNPEVCDTSGHDEDCDPATLGPDRDRDGFVSAMCCNRQPDGHVLCGTDCDDLSMDVNPTAPEVCDSLDDNCDGVVDEGVRSTFFHDLDGDGIGDSSMTRMGCSAPGGYVLIGGDCDDARAIVHPGAAETCNGLDDDCDGMVDEGVLVTFYRDADSDGFGAAGMTMTGCTAAAGYVANPTDCNDANPAIHPGVADAAPVCDMVDNNCDGTTDPGCGCTPGATQMCGTGDGMGGFLRVGTCHPGTQTCSGGMWGTCTGNVNPTTESCNGLDDDCDGVADDGAMRDFYPDCDGDGYGAAMGTPIAGCTAPTLPPSCGTGSAGWATNHLDCGDTDMFVRPGAPERCNRIYDDCSAGSGVRPIEDVDNDGHSSPTAACTTGPGLFAKDDCCDGDARAYPGATSGWSTARMGCGGYDFDCDGVETVLDTTLEHCMTACDTTSACRGRSGWGTLPACGESGSYVTCSGVYVGAGTCPGVNYQCRPTSIPQMPSCR